MTLKEIAAMAGTSTSTVSRVLNQTSTTCASRELQEKIWRIARENNYLPNEAAKSLKRPHQEAAAQISVSIVITRLSSLEEEPFFAELFSCLEAELFKKRVLVDQVLYAKSGFNEDISTSDGVIILGRSPETLRHSILSQNKNVVGIWRNPVDFGVDEVICDGKKAAELAMEHLFSLGHKKIAYIGRCSYESRYVGYCNMMFKNNMPLDYDLIKKTNQSREQAETAFLELLRQKKDGTSDFTAVFCANDNTAVRVLELLKEHRREVGKAPISVISIDDIDAAQDTDPFLTTVRIPKDEMAHMAVMLLLDRIHGGHEEIVRNEFPCRIIRRSSCHPV